MCILYVCMHIYTHNYVYVTGFVKTVLIDTATKIHLYLNIKAMLYTLVPTEIVIEH